MPKTSTTEISEHVAACLQLAILLEINAPKPGNVHRNANFHGTNYEHFLTSVVAVAPFFKGAALQGIKVAEGKINAFDVHIGRIIKDAVERVNAWQHGGNTLLGTMILLSPIAVAAGKTLRENKNTFDLQKLRKDIKVVVTATTPEDAVALYKAIDIAKPGGLNKASKFDATKASSKQELLETRTTLFDVFKISAEYDSVSNEWTNNYSTVFDTSLPFLKKELETKNSINDAVVHTFLKILAENPDTLIARKVGGEKAKEISKQAKQILQLGGVKTKEGKDALAKFDENLRDSENKLNPGTTADLITATLALHILSGYRP
jgi:triphosphoribosyl-dephospho-CoA synthase